MTIQFKNMGSSGMDLIKDSTGIVWVSITDSVFTQQMPLSNTDINNLITTLEYLKRLQPENLREDSFPSLSQAVDDDLDDMIEVEGNPVLTRGRTYTTSVDPAWNNVHAYNSSEAAHILSSRGRTINEDSYRSTTNNISKIKVTE